MHRIILGFATALALALPASAESVAETVARQLREQGYQKIETSYTWLGRLRVNAVQGEMRREIVINPNTGEILRDYEMMIPRMAKGEGVNAMNPAMGAATVTRIESDGDKVVDLVEPGTTVGDGFSVDTDLE
ncbi:MAG TPA: hypothetical protein PLH11_09550 [Gemmobacter sp.]|nr:hypothetical protein [Gemmobacter sp.]